MLSKSVIADSTSREWQDMTGAPSVSITPAPARPSGARVSVATPYPTSTSTFRAIRHTPAPARSFRGEHFSERKSSAYPGIKVLGCTSDL